MWMVTTFFSTLEPARERVRVRRLVLLCGVVLCGVSVCGVADYEITRKYDPGSLWIFDVYH